MRTTLVRVFAGHPLVEACYCELLAAYSDLRVASAFEAPVDEPGTVGIFDHEPASLNAVLVLSHRKFPTLRPILLSPSCDDHAKLCWLRSGMCGIVQYDQHKEDLYRAILQVANGQLWYPAALLRQHFSLGGASAGTEHAGGLTSREEEVISLILLMRSNKEIAKELRISERTAKFHVTNILRKTEVKSRQTLLGLHSASQNSLSIL